MNGGSTTIRGIGLLLVAAGGVVILGGPFREAREDRRVRAMLLEVQEALQNFHVREEIYPRRIMDGGELVAFLSEAGFLDEPLANPWTGSPFGGEGDDDRLRYRTDPLAETYELIVLEPDSEEVRFRLDSTENQSLEES